MEIGFFQPELHSGISLVHLFLLRLPFFCVRFVLMQIFKLWYGKKSNVQSNMKIELLVHFVS